MVSQGKKKPFLGDNLTDETDKEMAVDGLFAVVSDWLNIRLVLDKVIGLLDFLSQIILRENVFPCMLCLGDEDEEPIRPHLFIGSSVFRDILSLTHPDEIICLRCAVDADIGKQLRLLGG